MNHSCNVRFVGFLTYVRLQRNPDAAGFYFYTRFFLYDWMPAYNQSDLSILRYLNSTQTRDECTKFLYIPFHVEQVITHKMRPRSGFST